MGTKNTRSRYRVATTVPPMSHKGSRFHLREKRNDVDEIPQRRCEAVLRMFDHHPLGQVVAKALKRRLRPSVKPLGKLGMNTTNSTVHCPHKGRDWRRRIVKNSNVSCSFTINKYKWTDSSHECSGFGRRYCN